MLMFLVPIFVNIFDELGGELPTLTQYVMHASNLLRGYWFIIFPVVGGAIFAFFKWKKTEAGRQTWDRFKLRIPAQIGTVVRKVAMARWSRTLSTLIASGVDILRALEITAQTSGNWVVEEETGKVRTRVQEGATIAAPLIESTVFPPMISQMVKIGEESGELEKMLGEGRGLLRGRGRRVDRRPHLHHRAADDGRRRRHGRHHRDLDVPADVQAAHARQVSARDSLARARRGPRERAPSRAGMRGSPGG